MSILHKSAWNAKIASKKNPLYSEFNPNPPVYLGKKLLPVLTLSASTGFSVRFPFASKNCSLPFAGFTPTYLTKFHWLRVPPTSLINDPVNTGTVKSVMVFLLYAPFTNKLNLKSFVFAMLYLRATSTPSFFNPPKLPL